MTRPDLWFIGRGDRHDDLDVDFNDRRASRGRTECPNPAQDELRFVDLLGSFLAANAGGGGRSACEIGLELLMARVLVGTSGWGYGSWRGPFFPREVPAKHYLEYNASQFDTVELNGVFYRTPTAGQADICVRLKPGT
jgi:hypothetical protein